jgi:hydrogenase maturation protein HypF
MDARLSSTERSSVLHASLAATIADQAKAVREQYGINRIGLTGGVFQNRLLTEQTLTTLEKLGFEIYLHENIPSGDGGISFGQIIETGSKIP